jgi:aspartate 1-decarboxylase
MLLNMLKGKIHRATVTEANLNYVGSITIDAALMEAAGLLNYEQVAVVDIDNGNRLETYVIPGPRNSGTICLNGAAARLVCVGDRVIIMAYCQIESAEAANHQPTVVFVGEDNAIRSVARCEEAGKIE